MLPIAVETAIVNAVRSLGVGDGEAVLAWLDRVRRFQESLVSAYIGLEAIVASPRGAAMHAAPFFFVSHERTGGNVFLFGSASFLLANGAIPQDRIVAIAARSSPILRMRLWTAGARFTTPLDTTLLAADVGVEDEVIAPGSTTLVDLVALSSSGAGRRKDAASVPAPKLSRSAAGLISMHLRAENAGADAEVDGTSSNLVDFLAAAREMAAAAAAATHGSAASLSAAMGTNRGKADSEGSLLLFSEPGAAQALAQVLVDAVMPGATSLSGAAGTRGRRRPVPLHSLSLLSSAQLDVPQVVSLAPLRFRHACAVDADVSLRVIAGQDGTSQYELLARGMVLPTVLPRAVTLVGALQAAEAAAVGAASGAELVRVTGDAHSSATALCVPDLRSSLAQALGISPTDALQMPTPDASLPPITEEEADAIELLADVPWLDLSGVVVRARAPMRPGAPRTRADAAVRALALPETVIHAQPLRGPVAKAVDDAIEIEVPLS